MKDALFFFMCAWSLAWTFYAFWLRSRVAALRLRERYILQRIHLEMSPMRGSLAHMQAVIDAEKPVSITRREVLEELLRAEP